MMFISSLKLIPQRYAEIKAAIKTAVPPLANQSNLNFAARSIGAEATPLAIALSRLGTEINNV